jgi:hypothetical protein
MPKQVDPYAETSRLPVPDSQNPAQVSQINAPAPVPTRTPAQPPKQSWTALPMLSSMGIAIVIHVIIAVAVGSYVVFEGIVPVPFFESDFVDTSSQSSMIEEVPTLIEEEPLPTVASSQVETVQEEAGGSDAGPDMSDLITVSSSSLAPSFSMPTTAGNPALLSGNLFGGSGTGEGDGIGKGKVKLGSLFGSRNLGGGALTGYLYDFKQNSDKEPIKFNYNTISRSFTDSWKDKDLKEYFRSDNPLEVTQIFMPNMPADLAPKAFEVEKDVQPKAWMIHYQGKISPPRSGTFRFCGGADDVLIVRVDGDIVFDGSWSEGYSNANMSEVRQKIGASFGHGPGMFAGKWMRMRAGDVYPIEIALGEVPGGYFMAFLMVQEKGVDYDQNPKGYPILPVLQLMPTEIPDYEVNQKYGGFEVMKDGIVFGAN